MSGEEPDAPARGGFVGRSHRLPIRVYYEDTDAAGIVYYANYLRFMERGRSEMLRAMGIDQRAAVAAGIGTYAVADAHIRYQSPARLDDALVVVSELRALRAASATIHQRVMRGTHKLADATIVAAFLAPNGRPRRQPADWVERFRPLLPGEEDL